MHVVHVGEAVRDVLVGDTVRWQVEPASSGSPAGQRISLIVKPAEAGLKTSMVITTSRRTYHINLQSHGSRYMARVAFNYPEDVRKQLEAVNQRIADSVIPGAGVPAENLSFNFSISGQARWRPTRVYTDGRLADPRYVKALQEGQELPPHVDEKMKGQEAAAAAMPGMERFVYVGQGRFDLEMKLDGELLASSPAIGFPVTKSRSGNNFLTIERKEDGSVVISTPVVPQKALADLNSIGLPATGTVTVTAAGTVLEQNSDEVDGRAYTWHRDSWRIACI